MRSAVSARCGPAVRVCHQVRGRIRSAALDDSGPCRAPKPLTRGVRVLERAQTPPPGVLAHPAIQALIAHALPSAAWPLTTYVGRPRRLASRRVTSRHDDTTWPASASRRHAGGHASRRGHDHEEDSVGEDGQGPGQEGPGQVGREGRAGEEVGDQVGRQGRRRAGRRRGGGPGARRRRGGGRGPDGKKVLPDLPDEEFEKAVATDPSIVEDEKEASSGFVVSEADDTDEPEQQVMVAGATADPVKDYLKQIGKVPLLNAEHGGRASPSGSRPACSPRRSSPRAGRSRPSSTESSSGSPRTAAAPRTTSSRPTCGWWSRSPSATPVAACSSST